MPNRARLIQRVQQFNAAGGRVFMLLTGSKKFIGNWQPQGGCWFFLA
ncbi:hypothetical protein NC99_15160 [Sunxiuqinia dokdonensis]|uniref:Uncharacterized protein n=1 Tax=Sunxiuqinia dokdonensis TaxID=1409788 RepID=A0A0L8VBY1_9BACT|nr:hypothetical protein NC99_15160 [Sunxiuqinia dokdonensis]